MAVVSRHGAPACKLRQTPLLGWRHKATSRGVNSFVSTCMSAALASVDGQDSKPERTATKSRRWDTSDSSRVDLAETDAWFGAADEAADMADTDAIFTHVLMMQRLVL